MCKDEFKKEEGTELTVRVNEHVYETGREEVYRGMKPER